ncbi:hypothetical protein [Endozoicomonas sp. 8E]|uniref:hypothetical protein n=1 Tax=Endozoicomonas sp. 8E TaxID=3035692 RepID=UPI0029393CCB|nr:hypothetical protein [Endozoicomonas sp. 8E]WOG27002.1 hypothetical protein P6910_20990 [Endozoicomonas sp. 8E]
MLPAIGQTEPLTRRFIVELQQSSGLPKQGFSIKPYRSKWSDNPSGLADNNGYARLDLASNCIRQISNNYEVKTTIIESISWRWLCATNLLAAVKLIFTTRFSPLSSTPCSWLPVEAAIAVGRLLKGHWNSDSPIFNPIEHRNETTALTQRGHPFAIITMMFGSGNNQQTCQQKDQPPESSCQSPPVATGYFTSVLYPWSGDGNKGPQQQQHTLSLNCFVQLCYGVCKFRPSSESPGPAERSLNCEEGVASDGVTPDSTRATATTSPAGQATCYLIEVGKDGQLRQCEKVYKSTQALSNHKRRVHSRQKTCNVTVSMEDGQLQPCGKVCKNAHSLTSHKRNFHTGEKTCEVTMIGGNGQLRPCGKVCKSAQDLSIHKSKSHSGQRTCDMTIIGKNNQPQPCGKVNKNAYTLSLHKCRVHGRRRICYETVIEEDGQQRPCRTVCKNARVFSDHKRSFHTGLQTCDVTVVGKDGQQQPCGKTYKNAKSLSSHKSHYHTGQRTCDVIFVGKDGQLQLCGRDYKNAKALSDHKSKVHRGKKNFDIAIVGEGGQQRTCEKVFKNAKVMSEHKRKHRKRKLIDVEQNDDLSPPEGKANE